MIKKILIIDDDADEMDILTIAFRQIGLEVDILHEINPDNTVEVLERFRPHLLFLDYNMPKMNGLLCLDNIRKAQLPGSFRIIFYSSHITEEVRKKAIELGAIGCIEKAYNLDALVRKINRLLEVKDPI